MINKIPEKNPMVLGRDYSKYYEKILSEFKPKLIVEWGPGIGIDNDYKVGQTTLALELTDAQITTIEQDVRWLPKSTDRLNCLHIPVNSTIYTEVVQYKDYDFFFIDSRRRRECIQKVFNIMKNDALVFVHDAQRPEYRPAINLFPYITYFNNERFAVLCKSEKIFDRIKSLF
jgi:predicted O-methyltransferase YrrM